jgi:hypothetical protein
MQTIRNILLTAGAYYLSIWAEAPAVIAFAAITNRLTYTGDFEAAVLMPIVMGIPSAVVMALTGAGTTWAVSSRRPVLWSLLPALAYATSSAFAPHWSRSPETTADHVRLAVRALFPAVACVAGAVAFRLAVRNPRWIRR